MTQTINMVVDPWRQVQKEIYPRKIVGKYVGGPVEKKFTIVYLNLVQP